MIYKEKYVSNNYLLLILFLIQIQYIYSDNNFYEVSECSVETCPYPSICISSTVCQCKEGFYDTNSDENSNYSNKCKYEMKSSYSPFWVEIITNLGIGHMLIGNYYFGLLKLGYIIFTLGFFYYVCMSEANSKKNLGDCFHVILSLLNLLFCLGLLSWWVVDAVLFGINKYKDSNGIEIFEK